MKNREMRDEGYVDKNNPAYQKNIIWIIALPVVLGAAGYVLPSKISGNSSFTSEAAIAAGNYDHPLYNNTKKSRSF